jgi:hypothetical protein
MSYQKLDDENIQMHSLLYSYLYSTTPTFRNLSESKHLSYILKYKLALHKQLEIISNKSRNNKIYNKLIATDPLFLQKIINENENIDDILMIVIQEVLKTKYKIIIYKDESFLFPESFDDNDTFITFYLQNSIYQPVSIDDEFTFSTDNQHIVLMKLFTASYGDNNTNTNLDIQDDLQDERNDSLSNNDEQNTFDETINPIDNFQNEQIILLDENNVSIYDLDDTVSFIDKNISINFSDEEFDIECVKLFDDEYKPSNHTRFSKIHNQSLNVQPKYIFNHNYLINIDLQFNSVNNENMLNTESFLQKRTAFKSKFPWKPFHDPPYIQNTKYPSLITSTTSAIVLNDIVNNFIDAETECNTNKKYTVDSLKKIASKHNINIKGSKSNYCKTLTSYNFIRDHMISAYKNQYTYEQLKSIATDNSISTNKTKSINELISLLIDNNVLSNYCETSSLSLDDYIDIAKKHDLKPIDNLHDACIHYSHYNLLQDISKETTFSFCREDIEQFTVDVDEIIIPHNDNYINILPEDTLYSCGLFIKNDSFTHETHRFDLDNYINTFKHISVFPIHCIVYYHFNDKNTRQEKGKILSGESQLYKIKTKRKTFMYNLNDLSNNDCFIYTTLHNEYHFTKSHLFTHNIHFISQHFTSDQIRSMLSVKPHEFQFLHNNQSFQNELSTLNRFLFNFNSSFFNLHQNLLPFLKTHLSPIVFSEVKNITYINTYIPSSLPIFETIDKEYEFNNINDLERIMYIKYFLNEQDYIWKHIQPSLNIFEKKYLKNLEEFILDETQPLDISFNYRTNFSSFEGLIDFKTKFLEYSKIKKHNSLLQTYSKLKNILFNFSSIVENISARVMRTKIFDSLVHDKQIFLQQKVYDMTHKTNSYQGDVYQEEILKHTNDNILFIAPLPPSVKIGTKDLLNITWDILGISSNAKVMRYLQNKLNRYLAFMIKLLLRSHATKHNKNLETLNLSDVFKNYDEEQLWIDYRKITFFCAYTSILIHTNHIHINKKNVNYEKSINYSGYPNPEEVKSKNNHTLSHYLSSVVFFYFGQTNPNFKTVLNFITNIEQIIKLILSYEPELKTLIDTNYQKRKKLEKPLSNTYTVSFKPKQDSEIRSYIKNNINNSIVSKDFKLTNYTDTNQNNLIDSSILIQKQYTQTYNKFNINFNFPKNVVFIDSVSPPTFESIDMEILDDSSSSDENSIELRIQEYILNMTKHFKLDFNDFINTFMKSSSIVKTKYFSNVSNSKLIIAIINIILSDSYFTSVQIDDSNSIEQLSKIITKNTYDMNRNIFQYLSSIIDIFKIVFDTTEPFTFIDYNQDHNTAQLYDKVLHIIQEHIDSMILFVKHQTTSFTDLSIKKNEYRNEEKQNEMNKYNNLSDEDTMIVKSLQKLGISIDISQNLRKVPQDDINVDIDESFRNVRSSDDNVEE